MMTVIYICDSCLSKVNITELHSLLPIVDKQLCSKCFTRLKAILDDFWGDKK